MSPSSALLTTLLVCCVCVMPAVRGRREVEGDADQGIPHPTPSLAGGVPHRSALHDSGSLTQLAEAHSMFVWLAERGTLHISDWERGLL